VPTLRFISVTSGRERPEGNQTESENDIKPIFPGPLQQAAVYGCCGSPLFFARTHSQSCRVHHAMRVEDSAPPASVRNEQICQPKVALHCASKLTICAPTLTSERRHGSSNNKFRTHRQRPGIPMRFCRCPPLNYMGKAAGWIRPPPGRTYSITAPGMYFRTPFRGDFYQISMNIHQRLRDNSSLNRIERGKRI